MRTLNIQADHCIRSEQCSKGGTLVPGERVPVCCAYVDDHPLDCVALVPLVGIFQVQLQVCYQKHLLKCSKCWMNRQSQICCPQPLHGFCSWPCTSFASSEILAQGIKNTRASQRRLCHLKFQRAVSVYSASPLRIGAWTVLQETPEGCFPEPWSQYGAIACKPKCAQISPAALFAVCSKSAVCLSDGWSM